jgi:phosphoserine phosphatase RsbU/P
MATLIIHQGPNVGEQFPLKGECTVIGRAVEATICLPSQAVSRRHAQVLHRDGAFLVEDLGSANGTRLNGQRIRNSTPLKNGDRLKVGDHVFLFHEESATRVIDSTILSQVEASFANRRLYAENPGQKLQIILELTRDLGQTVELQPLLDRALVHLLQLFPLAERGLVVLSESEPERLVVRAQRSRRGDADYRFSRTVIHKALEDGVGILSRDVHVDERFAASDSLQGVAISSLLCAPLILRDGKRLGAIQLDCTQLGQAFEEEHLHLLTAVGLQLAVVLDNVALNELRVRQETLRRDLALGRQIQLGFLPTDFTLPEGSNLEIFACIHPAREVSGDLYDFFPLADGRLAFLVGDVSDKGIPAALFMVKVQTLVRHLAAVSSTPAATLAGLNRALADHNTSLLYVTMVLGVCDPRTGEVVLASGGHPRPLLRRPDGGIEEVTIPPGRLLGCLEEDPQATDRSLTLAPGETLILYSDGYTEAAVHGTKNMLGLPAFKAMLDGAQTQLSLAECAANVHLAVEHFVGATEMQDDLTLLLLRRPGESIP